MFSVEFLEACKAATRNAFEGKVDAEGLEKLLSAMPVPSSDTEMGIAAPTLADVKVPSPIHAEASIVSAVIWSTVKCSPKNPPYNGWYYDEQAWGVGIGGGSSEGFMYTAYDSFEALFKYTTAYHVQGIAATGGILQINWFNKDGVPVGQFNGVLAGAGGFEMGGSGKWKKK